MKATDITNNPKITNVEVSNVGTGLNLYFEYDGRAYDITGEFYIDRNNILHHTIEDDNFNEIVELLVKLEF